MRSGLFGLLRLPPGSSRHEAWDHNPIRPVVLYFASITRAVTLCSFAGILYPARHDLSSSLWSIALFSEKAGMASSVLIQERTFDIPSYVIAEAASDFSVSVVADDRAICDDDDSTSDDEAWDLSDGPEGI